MPEPQISASPHFKMIFLSVLGLTILLLGADIALAIFSGAHTEDARVTCDTLGKVGAGAIIGLLGGKVSTS